MTASLLDTLLSVGNPRVLVIGDLILDRYVWGETNRISPEAPIPILTMRQEESRPGGAGNVVNALAHLKARPTCCGVVGDDADGRLLSGMLRQMCGGRLRIWTDKGRPTTSKSRFIGYVQSAGRATHHMLRVDSEDARPVPAAISAKISAFVRANLPRQDAVILSDYDKGLLSPTIIGEIIAACRRSRVPVIVDPKLGKDYRVYRGATVVTPNRYETQVATGIPIRTEKDMLAAAEKLQKALDLSAVVLTLDRDGMFLYEAGKRRMHTLVPTLPREIYDVTGAGDMVVSTLALLLGAGAGFREAVELANVAAGIEVGKVGAAPVSREEIRAELGAREEGLPAKLKSPTDLLDALGELRRKKKNVVFTNGCFDLLHIGHVGYLKFARRQGDALVVGLNSDRSVTALKGRGRPILKQEERANILAALEDVNYIVIFDELTPEKLIRRIRPDVLVKGEDWRDKGVVGSEFVHSYGGQVVLAPLTQGASTTDIVSRILQKHSPAAGKPRRRM